MRHSVAASRPTGRHAVKFYDGFGIKGADIPTDGDDGPSPALNDGISPTGEYAWRIVTPPSAGVLTIHRDLSFTYGAMGVPAGVYTAEYQLLEFGQPQTPLGVMTFTVGTAGVSLSINDATHAHGAESVSLSWETLLAISNAGHAHASDTASISVSVLLSVSPAAHGHTAGNLDLDTSNATILTAQDTEHGHSADNLGLSAETLLSVASAIHGHLSNSLTLGGSLEIDLSVADASHGHTAQAVVLSLPSVGGTCPTVEEIAAAVIAAAQITPIHADMRRVKGQDIAGTGSDTDPWGPA